MLNVLPEVPKRDIGVIFLCDSQCTALALNPSLSQKERRRHNVCIRISRNLANISAMNGRTLINLYWLSGSRNPADLSSKTHHNLASVVNGSFYRHGHSSYSNTFPCEQSILFATMKAGTYKFRGLTSLTNHTSQCHYCCSKFSREVAGVLIFHTELLGPGGPTTSTTNAPAGYDEILAAANSLQLEDTEQVTSLDRVSDELTYGQQLYSELLARFSCINKLIV